MTNEYYHKGCKPSPRGADCSNGILINNIHSDFQAIVIPSSLGDSTTGSYKPAVGAYKNAIVSYKKDGNSYIYDDKGHYNLLSNSGASVVIVDSALSTSSENPVQNKAITSTLTTMQDTLNTHNSRINTNASNITTNTNNISTIDDTLSDAVNDILVLQTQNGTETLTTVAQTISGAVNELVSTDAGLNTRLTAVEAIGGEPNVIEEIDVNGTAQAVVDKTVNLTVPTTVAELSDASSYYTAADVDSLIGDVPLTIYPIGSVYSTVDSSINPADAFGGTWVSMTNTTIGSETVYNWKRTV